MISKKIVLFSYRSTESFIFKHFWFNQFRSVRYFRRYLYKLTSKYKSSYVEIEGRKMFLDKNDSLKISIYPYAKSQTDFFKKNIQKGDVVLDLGANIGYFTCLFADLVGPTGKVFAFEPEENNFQLLKKNVAVNGYDNVILEQKAVSNKTEKIKMFIATSPKDHRIYDPLDDRESTDIDCVTLDDYFKNFDEDISFVKSNVQGADFGVFQGMNSILKKQNSNIVLALEFSPAMLQGFGSNPEEFIDLIFKNNFKLFDLNPYKKIFSVTKKQLLNEYTIENKKKYTRRYGRIEASETELTDELLEEIVNQELKWPWNWERLSSHPQITFNQLKKHRDLPWRWFLLSRNPNFTEEWIWEFGFRKWDFLYLSNHSEFSIELINMY